MGIILWTALNCPTVPSTPTTPPVNNADPPNVPGPIPTQKGHVSVATTPFKVIASDKLQFAATGLPPGVVINPNTGDISGMPTTQGTYNGQVTVTNQSGKSSSQPLNFDIGGPPADFVDTTSETENRVLTTSNPIQLKAGLRRTILEVVVFLRPLTTAPTVSMSMRTLGSVDQTFQSVEGAQAIPQGVFTQMTWHFPTNAIVESGDRAVFLLTGSFEYSGVNGTNALVEALGANPAAYPRMRIQGTFD